MAVLRGEVDYGRKSNKCVILFYRYDVLISFAENDISSSKRIGTKKKSLKHLKSDTDYDA